MTSVSTPARSSCRRVSDVTSHSDTLGRSRQVTALDQSAVSEERATFFCRLIRNGRGEELFRPPLMSAWFRRLRFPLFSDSWSNALYAAVRATPLVNPT